MCDGCNGSIVNYAFDYIRDFGLTLEKNYPYKGVDSCKHLDLITKILKLVKIKWETYPCKGAYQDCRSLKPFTKIKGYEMVPNINEFELKKIVAQQPVVTVIFAGSKEFFGYKGGVFKEACSNEPEGKQLLHDVLIIGYGIEENGDEYWLIQNSWGPRWGEGGFGKILRNNPEGKCGVHIFSFVVHITYKLLLGESFFLIFFSGLAMTN